MQGRAIKRTTRHRVEPDQRPHTIAAAPTEARAHRCPLAKREVDPALPSRLRRERLRRFEHKVAVIHRHLAIVAYQGEDAVGFRPHRQIEVVPHIQSRHHGHELVKAVGPAPRDGEEEVELGGTKDGRDIHGREKKTVAARRGLVTLAFHMACDLILVLDAPSTRDVLPVLRPLQGTVRWVKIGLEMFTASGPDCVREVAGLGFKVFLDLKLHDIPNTVAKAVESVSKLPIGMLTLHTSGGRDMIQWAVKAQQEHAPGLLLLGVTVLTSTSAAGLAETGVPFAPADQVVRLGQLATEAGLRGLVCSPLEIVPLRAALPKDITLVTPGIRPREAKADDQHRVMTPAAAAEAGANYLVVGRPIFKAPDPVAAARAILAELELPKAEGLKG